MKVVIVGGGWAGCAAAVSARKQGVDVTLLERTDLLLGTGLVGGIMRNNRRFTATEEAIAMGGDDLFHITDAYARHQDVNFHGHAHASLYDICKTPVAVTDHMLAIGVDVKLCARITCADMEGKAIIRVYADNGACYEGNVFVDATGTAGPPANCIKYGNGCVMCILRCPTFGGRVSLTALAGVEDIQGRKASGEIGAMSGACKLNKESLAPEIVRKLEEKGVAVIPVPENLVEDHLDAKACQQYAQAEFAENIVLLDTDHVKLMAPYYNLERLRQVPGFEYARFEDPYSGGQGNSMRFFAMAPHDDTMKVDGVMNLFCAGEKAGLLVGHTEAIVTGMLAGVNAARLARSEDLVTLPRTLAVGEAIAFVREQMKTEHGLNLKYTFSGSVLFERMKTLNLYTTDVAKIRERVAATGLMNAFEKNGGANLTLPSGAKGLRAGDISSCQRKACTDFRLIWWSLMQDADCVVECEETEDISRPSYIIMTCPPLLYQTQC